MSTVSSLRDVFSRGIPDPAVNDADLAALAKLILLESIEKKDSTTSQGGAERYFKETNRKAKEALTLLCLWDQSKVPMPKTLRVLLDALLQEWATSFVDEKFEKEIADALLSLEGLDEKETGQLEEALRHCGKNQLYYQPQKLLRILVGATDKQNKIVVHWTFTTLTRTSPVDHLRFAAVCLLTCGKDRDNPPMLEEAAKHHIAAAAATFAAVKEMRFAEARGGPFKPMGEEYSLHTAGLVEFVWVTPKMGEALENAVRDAHSWLAAAESQVFERLGLRDKRSFDVKLTVKIFPYENNWFMRRDELEPLETLSNVV